jgi:hypothetical protein
MQNTTLKRLGALIALAVIVSVLIAPLAYAQAADPGPQPDPFGANFLIALAGLVAASTFKIDAWLTTKIASKGYLKLATGGVAVVASALSLLLTKVASGQPWKTAGGVALGALLIGLVALLTNAAQPPSASNTAGRSASRGVPPANGQAPALRRSSLAPGLAAVVGAVIAVVIAACIPARSPSQQWADAETEIGCVQRDWGQPIATIAHDCTQDAIAVAEDLVADVELLFGLFGGSKSGALVSTSPYAALPGVQASVLRKSGRPLVPASAAPGVPASPADAGAPEASVPLPVIVPVVAPANDGGGVAVKKAAHK